MAISFQDSHSSSATSANWSAKYVTARLQLAWRWNSRLKTLRGETSGEQAIWFLLLLQLPLFTTASTLTSSTNTTTITSTSYNRLSQHLWKNLEITSWRPLQYLSYTNRILSGQPWLTIYVCQQVWKICHYSASVGVELKLTNESTARRSKRRASHFVSTAATTTAIYYC